MNTFIALIGIILFIGGFVLLALKKNNKVFFNGQIPIIAVGFVLFIAAQCFTIIPTGYTGVRVILGQVQDRASNNGLCWKIPFVENIKLVNNKQQDIEFGNKIWGETSDRTVISYSGVTVTYSISGEKSSWIYSHVSNYKDSLVSTTLVSSAIKTASKTLTDVDATNRGKMEPLAQETIQKSLDNKYSFCSDIFDFILLSLPFSINKVIIDNADFEDSYNEAIAAKQQAQLEYEQQQITNQKNVETAKAEAEAKKIAAQGEADANAILASSLSEDIFRQMIIEKWNGVLPLVTGDKDTIIDLGALTGSGKEQ